jgi:hypothetical protein
MTMTVRTGNFNVQGIWSGVSTILVSLRNFCSHNSTVLWPCAMRLLKALVRSYPLVHLVKQTPRLDAKPSHH